MVFKSWSEQRAPRHLLEDNEEDYSTPQRLPTISTTDSSALSSLTGTLLLIPSTLKFLPETLDKLHKDKATIAELVIKKKFTRRIDPDEFIEDEQLYSVNGAEDDLHEEVVSTKSPVVQYTPTLAICMVKNYDNNDKINYNLIASELLKHTSSIATIVTITPGTLSFDQNIATLAGDWDTRGRYHALVPPFVVTGIAGALVSQAQVQGRQVSALILQSEGVPGFEKVSEYAVDELAALLNEKFEFGREFTKTLNTLLHSGKSVNNFGLYL